MRPWLLLVAFSLGCPWSESGGPATTDAPGGASSTHDPGSSTTTTAGTDAPTSTSTLTSTDALTSTGALPNGCPEGHVALHNQVEVEALAGCTHIFGELMILEGVRDLTPLAALRTVDGNLGIYSPQLTSLAGLEGLESVGQLYMGGYGIISLEPLAGLTDIPGRVHLGNFDQLESLEGLHNLEHIGKTLELFNIPGLGDLSGLRGLKRIDGGLVLRKLPIVDLHGLEALTEIGTPGESSGITFDELPQLTSLAGRAFAWSAHHTVGLKATHLADLGDFAGTTELRALRIHQNPALVSLAGLESLAVVSNRLEILHNEALVDISGLANLETVRYLTFEGDQPFTSFAPLAALATVERLELVATALTDLDGLASLPQIGRLHLQSNEQLVGLSGLANYTILGSLTLDANPALADLSGLAALVTMTGTLDIRGNNAITTVSGIAALTEIGGRLIVVNNPELPCSAVFAWAAPLTIAHGHKIAGNKDCDPPADPCPWTNDGECDDEDGGLGICVKYSDTDCCHALACERPPGAPTHFPLGGHTPDR